MEGTNKLTAALACATGCHPPPRLSRAIVGDALVVVEAGTQLVEDRLGHDVQAVYNLGRQDPRRSPDVFRASGHSGCRRGSR